MYSGNKHMCEQMITRMRRKRATFLVMAFCIAMAANSVRRCVCGCGVEPGVDSGAVLWTRFPGASQHAFYKKITIGLIFQVLLSACRAASSIWGPDTTHSGLKTKGLHNYKLHHRRWKIWNSLTLLWAQMQSCHMNHSHILTFSNNFSFLFICLKHNWQLTSEKYRLNILLQEIFYNWIRVGIWDPYRHKCMDTFTVNYLVYD